jgi:ribosomal protein L16 Arg81 hydroxylase
MPASIRIIKIVKDPVTQEETYTVELEIEAEKSKDLLTEISSCPMGKELMELLNQAKFIPELTEKTAEQIREEAEKEEKEIQEHDEKMTKEGMDKMCEIIYDKLKENPKFKQFFGSLNYESFCRMFEEAKEEEEESQ